MNESIDDLIQRVLDGDGDPADQLRLESRLASDPSARRRYDELSRVFAGLKEVHLEEAPAGLRDDVIRAIRASAPARNVAPQRTPRPAFSWLRLVLPIAAGATAALVLFATLGRTPWPGGDRVAGTMSAADPTELRLGSGRETVVVRSSASPGGFLLRITTGDVPVTVRLETVGGALLARSGEEPPSASLEASIPVNAQTLVEGTAGPADSVVRVRVDLPGGRIVSGEVRVPAGASPR